jgi:hypothetical protein
MAVRQQLPRWGLGLAGLAAFLASYGQAANDAAVARMQRDVTYLASDECEGRGVTTKGINLAADYIAGEFQKAGLKPAGPDGSYFQPFTLRAPAGTLGSPNTLALRGPLEQRIELAIGRDFQVVGMSGTGKLVAPVVFVGYGITAKEEKPKEAAGNAKPEPGFAGYDDYANVDVAGKIVLLIRKTPRSDNRAAPFHPRMSDYFGALNLKLQNAEQHKAAAVIVVNAAGSDNADPLMSFSEFDRGPGGSIPMVQVHRSLADEMLRASLGRSLRELEQDIDRDLKPQSGPLSDWKAFVETHVGRDAVHVKNVIGVLEGAGPLAKETVVIGAHYDHLGYGRFFGSMAPANVQGKAIHHGADDNGSGSTAVMELARRFGQIPNRQGRRLVFMTFSGEESGLLGSQHYCANPIFSLADTVAMVNLDMVGRLRPDNETHKDRLIVYGTGTGTNFDKELESLNAKYDFQLKKFPGSAPMSDQHSFYNKQIPVYFFFTDLHQDYHRPSDTADKINLAGMEKITDMVEHLVDYLQNVPERPHFTKVAGSNPDRPRGQGPTLGIAPSYSDAGEGVLVDGVTEGRPAAKAGIKSGDRIVELAGQSVKNLSAYMTIMNAQKKGEKLDVTVLRSGKKVAIKVTLD